MPRGYGLLGSTLVNETRIDPYIANKRHASMEVSAGEDPWAHGSIPRRSVALG